ncbi:MAG: KH domain-containing protein [Patescibacteria group bacterium]|nr:KH domain-containing protein [Patescibacteria group bacterium]MCL5432077.1 KH domain-containing protein [Patescibacteria group bacterium]
MKSFLEYLVQNIVDKPEAVHVSEESQAGMTVLKLSVDGADMGKVIGKSGRIIKAIRDLTRILAVKQNARVNVVVSEE